MKKQKKKRRSVALLVMLLLVFFMGAGVNVFNRSGKNPDVDPKPNPSATEIALNQNEIVF